MTEKNRFFPYFKPLALAVALAAASSAHGAESAKGDAVQNPWAFNLNAYLWLPSIDGTFSAGPFTKSSDFSFGDIAGKMRNFPMAFNGHFEAHYERLGFYLDGNYLGADFRPVLDQGYSKGLSTRMGIMEYGASYRLFGPSASERVAHWEDKSRSNILDIYAGGRTIWLGNEAEFVHIGTVSNNKSISAPLVGGRIIVEFSPKWFAKIDGSVGGFGVDNVSFTGSALGIVGYRTRLFGVPASVEAGYKALSVKVDKRILTTDIIMHGPFLGLTGYW
jgi:hypothetical protein